MLSPDSKRSDRPCSLMDHANIVHVLDAGATAGGRPYFVMELVRGIKIRDGCVRAPAGAG
jgi:hypothetical protein